jgi:hypothetical protein
MLAGHADVSIPIPMALAKIPGIHAAEASIASTHRLALQPGAGPRLAMAALAALPQLLHLVHGQPECHPHDSGQSH